MSQEDKLYAKSRDLVDAFQFDEQVTQVFDDMIRRSVPGYTMMLDTLAVVAEKHVQANTYCYDLGCSLGASTLAMRHSIKKDNVTLIGVDNSQPMIDRCQSVMERDNSSTPVDILCQDILDVTFQPASLISMNLTLQFIDPEERLGLLTKIADSLVDGGALFLSEKLAFSNPIENQRQIDLHHQFKMHQGYSELEIAQKRSAIENVLIPETLEAHTKRLLKAGFKQVTLVFQCFNFAAIVAYK